MNEISKLLQNIQKQCDINKINSDKDSYNVFSVLGVAEREVLICRMIADLLDPQGAHGQGTVFLESFLEDVLGLTEITLKSLNTAEIITEYVIGNSNLPDNAEANNRRIDIVIQIESHFIPIEVKVYAADQKFQCLDYYRFARKHDPSAKIYYLTPFGKKPGDESIKRGNDTIPENDIVTISFQKDILLWLEKCLQNCNSDSVKEILRQFIISITLFANQLSMGEIEKTAKETALSAQNLQAGMLIADALDEAKAIVLRRVFEEFEKQMQPLLSPYSLVREEEIHWQEYKERANRDFFHGKSTCPGLTYIVKNVSLPENYQLWFRIEVDWNLFAGFCIFDLKQKTVVTDFTDIDTSTLESNGLPSEKYDGPWLNWWYLPNGNRKVSRTVPNFRSMNQAAVNLADEKNCETLVQKSIECIKNNLWPKTGSNPDNGTASPVHPEKK